MNQQEFINNIKDRAIQGWSKYKILPSVTIAQSILESGWGASELGLKANNLFGIKANSDWTGESYIVRTAEYDKDNNKYYIDTPFRKYKSWDESIDDHSKFFSCTQWRKENYSSFIGQTDYKVATKKLQECGYATSQIYAQSLCEIIEKYKLYQYDEVAINNIKNGEKSMRIFLSVGHSILRGGGSTSASGFIHEYRYNKELAPYIKREIENLGHKCDLIICPEQQFTSWLQEKRYKLPIANSGEYDLICELHLNCSNGCGHGSEVFYYHGDKRGENIADKISNNLAKLGFTNRGSKTAQLYMTNETVPLAVLVESFFCDNRSDCNIANSVGFESIAKAIANGLCNKVSNITEPEIKYTDAKYSVQVSTQSETAKVYEKPSTLSKVVGEYNDGSKIYVEQIAKETNGNTWFKLETGFIRAIYCKEIKADNEVEHDELKTPIEAKSDDSYDLVTYANDIDKIGADIITQNLQIPSLSVVNYKKVQDKYKRVIHVGGSGEIGNVFKISGKDRDETIDLVQAFVKHYKRS